jgi:Uma2 family endonuclease
MNLMSLANHLTVDLTRFPESDGVPLDSAWERDAINLLVHLTRQHFADRQDFYTGGNMFIYYDPDDPRKNAGPDYFYVSGTDRARERRIWAVWVEQNRFPDAIIELSSPSTARFDRGKKKTIYEQTFKTPEYYIYNPDKQSLVGWRLVRGKYKELEPNDRGWLWSEELGVWIGTWEGPIDDRPDVWLRFYDRRGRLVPTAAEEGHQRAERQRRRADEERQRAEAAEAEVARLKAMLKKHSS